MPEFYHKLCDMHPRLDIFPPKDLVVLQDVSCFKETDEVYKPVNPYLSYLAYHNPGRFRDKIVPFPIPPGMAIGNQLRLSAWDRTSLESAFNSGSFYAIESLEIPLIKPTKRCIISDEWYDPYSVLSFCSSYYRTESIVKGHKRPGLQDYVKFGPTLQRLSDPNHPKLLAYLITRLGYQAVVDVDLTYVQEEIVYAIQKKKALEFARVREKAIAEIEERSILMSDPILSEFSYHESLMTDASLHDEDFFTWLSSKQNYKDWRNTFFVRMKMVLDCITMEKADLNPGEINRDPSHVFSEVERYFYEKSGGRLDKDGYPIVDVGFDAFFDTSSVANQSSEESAVGLFPGWADG